MESQATWKSLTPVSVGSERFDDRRREGIQNTLKHDNGELRSHVDSAATSVNANTMSPGR